MASMGADGEYNLEIGHGDSEEDDEQRNTADDTLIVRFVNKVLLDAIKQGASDIHFEPYEKEYRCGFTDGSFGRSSNRRAPSATIGHDSR